DCYNCFMRKLQVLLALSTLLLPSIASARTLFDVLSTGNALANGLVGTVFTIAVIVFFWGLVRYLVSVGEQKAKGLTTMFYGIITLTVMVSIWGIIAVLQNTFLGGGVPTGGPPDITKDMPKVNGYQQNTQP